MIDDNSNDKEIKFDEKKCVLSRDDGLGFVEQIIRNFNSRIICEVPPLEKKEE